MAEVLTRAERNVLPTVRIDDRWLAGERLLSKTLLKRRPDELSVTIGEGRGRTPRTDTFAKLVLAIALERDGDVPLSFETADGQAVMLDWGCVGYLAKHRPPEVDLMLDGDGFVSSIRPTNALAVRYSALISIPAGKDYWAAFARAIGTPEAGWAQSEQSWIRPRSQGGLYLSCAYNSQAGWLRVGITAAGSNADDDFVTLLAQRSHVERFIGEPLEWDAKDGRNERQIFVKLTCNPGDAMDWPRQHVWMAERLPKFESLLTSAT